MRAHALSSSSHVQSHRDLLSAKIDQPTVLIHDTHRYIGDVPRDDRQINDLRRDFRHFISRWNVRRELVYRMRGLAVAVRPRRDVAFYANDVNGHDIYRLVGRVPLIRL